MNDNFWNFLKDDGFIVENPFIEKWQTIFHQKYAEPQRFYHNLFHIERLLQEYSTTIASQLEGDKQEQLIIILSIWFHDLVYDPKKKDNE